MKEVTQLLQADSLANVIFNSSAQAMFVIGVEPNDLFRCITANKAYFDQTKLKPEQVIGKIIEEILPPEALPVASQGYKKAILKGTPVKYEERIDFGFGLDIVETIITPVLDENNICTLLIGSSRNIKPEIESDKQVRMLAQTLRSINECVSITDTENHIIYVNEAFLKTYGYQENELIGKHISTIKSRNSDPLSLEELTAKTLSGGWQGELMNRRKDGTEFPVFVSASPVFNDQNELIAMVGVSQDLTKHKQTEQQLLDNEKWIKLITESTPDIIYVFSVKENRNIYLNRSIAKMLGYNEGELDEYSIGFLTEYIHPDNLQQFEVFYKKIQDWDPEFVYSFEYRMKTKHGDWRWFKGNEKEFQREKGKVITLIGSVQDITERKMAEEKLRESEERYRLLANNASDSIALYDENFKPIYLSPASFTIAGYSKDEVHAMNVFDIVHPDDKARLFEEMAESKAKKMDKSSYIYRIIHKDGHYIWIETVSNHVYSDDKLVKTIAVSRDVTIRKKAEEAIMERNEKFRFLSKSTTEMLNLPDLPSIYQYICTNIHLQYRDSIVLFISVDEKAGLTTLEKLAGIENNLLKKIIDMTGFSPLGNKFKILPEHHKYFKSGKFSEFPGGLVEFASSEFPAFAAKMIQKLLGIKNIYTIGINNGNDLLAAVHVMTLKGTIITDHDYIETFVRQAGVIIQRKVMLENLMASEEKYRLITENSADAIVVLDAGLKFTYVSPSASKIIGFTPEEIKKRELSDLVTHESLTKLNQMLDEKVSALGSNETDFEKVYQLEVELKHKNGSITWAESSISFLKNNQNNLSGIIAVVRDITERRRALEQLRFQSLILDQIQDLVTATDLNGMITYVNDAELKMMGRNREDIIGKHVKIYGEDPSRGGSHNEILSATLKTGQWIGEMVNFNAEGKPIELEVKTQLIFDIDGNPIGLCGISVDASIRKQAEQKLIEAKEKAEAADKLKTSFMNNISHEVRTPLNGILGYAGLLAEWDLSNEEKKDYINMLGLSSERLVRTITDYMDISLLTSGNMEVHPQKMCPDDYLKNLFSKFNRLCSSKNLSLILDLPEKNNSGNLITDPELFSKLIHHLLDNALKFTSSGSINFGYKIMDNHLHFFVNDTGIGINKENLEMIFKPFSQEDITDTRGHEGSGLGLSIVKGIAELLGGTIEVKSKKGKGSVFTFIIHNETTSPALVIAIPEKEISDPPFRQTLLLAEDDFASFKYFDVLFSRLHIDLIHANNGQEAVDLCRKHPEIGLVLMDLKMPVMNGLEATRIIKQFRPELPIIAQTAFALSGDEFIAREAGCDDYLPKPITKKALTEKLEQYGFSFLPVKHMINPSI